MNCQYLRENARFPNFVLQLTTILIVVIVELLKSAAQAVVIRSSKYA